MQAAALAAQCGSEVLVRDQLTAYETVWATPEGSTRWELAAAAVRSPEEDGGWRLIDATISSVPVEGRLEVAAPAGGELSFSDGSAGEPLAVLATADGHELAFDVPFELTVPVVDGRQVTYPQVLAGVDLIVTVAEDASGYTEVLRVADAQAAASPALADLVFPVEVSEGLDVAAPEDVASAEGLEGGLVAVDVASGEPVMRSAAPRAWDSAAPEPVVAELQAQGLVPEQQLDRVDGFAEVSAAGVAAGVAAERAVDRSVGPLDGDLVVEMPVDLVEAPVEGADLGVAVDASALLDDPGVVFPVFVDPGWTLTLSEWAYIQSAYPSSVHYMDSSGSGQSLPVGGCTAEIECSPLNKNRTVWEFTDVGRIADLDSSMVEAATFSVVGVHSYNCTASQVELWHTWGIDGGTTWNNHASHWTGWLDTVSVAHKSTCPRSDRVTFNAVAAARSLADTGGGTLTVGLKATDETNVAQWKRFRYDAQLSVTYANRAPDGPGDMKVSDPVAGCGTQASPAFVRSLTPQLSVRVSDPDSAVTGQKLLANFEVWTGGSKKAWSNPATATYSSGGPPVTWRVDAQLVDGVTYDWYSSVEDDLGATGAVGRCTFTVDVTAPVAPRVTPVPVGGDVQAEYSSGSPAPARGGAGVTGKFALSTGSADTVKFQCSFVAANQVADCATPANPVISFVPSRPGPVTLYVQAVDRVGLPSAVTEHTFDVAYPVESGLWTFDDYTGPADRTADDTSGADPAHPLTLNGNATGDGAGPHGLFHAREVGDPDHALVLDGDGDSAESIGAVLDTSKSFTVAAMVRLNSGASGAAMTAVSQDGTSGSGFQLGYRESCGSPARECWSMGMWPQDGAGAWSMSQSTLPVVRDEWVLLVGEHNATAHTVRLWVCEVGTPGDPAKGEPVAADAQAYSTTWQSWGPLAVGRSKFYGTPRDYWSGLIDDVRVFSGQIVAEAKIRRLCQGAEAGDFPGALAGIDPTEPITTGTDE